MQFAGQTLTKESRFPRVYDIYFLNSVLWFFRNYTIHFSDCMITTAILTLPFLTSSCNRDYLTAQSLQNVKIRKKEDQISKE